MEMGLEAHSPFSPSLDQAEMSSTPDLRVLEKMPSSSLTDRDLILLSLWTKTPRVSRATEMRVGL